jgi:hypothetical protein
MQAGSVQGVITLHTAQMKLVDTLTPISQTCTLTLASHLHLGLPSGLILYGFQIKISYNLSFAPCVLYVSPIRFPFILPH